MFKLVCMRYGSRCDVQVRVVRGWASLSGSRPRSAAEKKVFFSEKCKFMEIFGCLKIQNPRWSVGGVDWLWSSCIRKVTTGCRLEYSPIVFPGLFLRQSKKLKSDKTMRGSAPIFKLWRGESGEVQIIWDVDVRNL